MKLRIEHCKSPYPNLSKSSYSLGIVLGLPTMQAKEIFLSMMDTSNYDKVWLDETQVQTLIAEGWYFWARTQDEINQEILEEVEMEDNSKLYDEAKQWYDGLDEKTKSYVDILNVQLVAIG